MKPAPFDQNELDRDEAKADYIKGFCPDVEELTPAPEITCKCGFQGRVKVILSYLKEALCPECKSWISYEEIKQ